MAVILKPVLQQKISDIFDNMVNFVRIKNNFRSYNLKKKKTFIKRPWEGKKKNKKTL